MTRSQYIKRMQANGWLLWQSNDHAASFVCRHVGCPGARVVTAETMRKGRVRAACSFSHTKGYGQELVNEYMDLAQHLRARRIQMGLSQEDVEAAGGFTPDHIGKAEIGDRLFRLPTFIAWAKTLGYDLALVPSEVPPQVLAILDHKAGQVRPDRSPPKAMMLGGFSDIESIR